MQSHALSDRTRECNVWIDLQNLIESSIIPIKFMKFHVTWYDDKLNSTENNSFMRVNVSRLSHWGRGFKSWHGKLTELMQKSTLTFFYAKPYTYKLCNVGSPAIFFSSTTTGNITNGTKYCSNRPPDWAWLSFCREILA